MTRICFMGTPELAVSALKGLEKSSDLELCLILTQPDRRSGRGKKIQFSPVKEYGLEKSIEVLQPQNFKSEYKELLSNLFKEKRIDLFLVLAYGQILPKSFLEDFPDKVLNIHGSLLPKYRGASPIHEAILRGDSETGITLMKIIRKMDAGPMIAKRNIKIDENDSSTILTDKFYTLIEDNTASLLAGYLENPESTKQNEAEASYCKKIDKLSGKINWSKGFFELDRLLKAYGDWPSLFCFFETKRIKILSFKKSEIDHGKSKDGSFVIENNRFFAKCSDSWIEIVKLQLEGKKAMLTSDCLRGAKLPSKGSFDEH